MFRLLTAVLLLLLPVSALRAEPPARVIDDEQIIDTFVKRMTALREDGNCVPVATLRAQLKDFQQVALKLPPPRRREIDDEAYYNEMCRSIAVIGVIAKDENGNWVDDSIASAWIATADGVLVTNYHVIDGPEDSCIGVMLPDGGVHPVRSILASSRDADIAVVKIDATDLVPLALAADPPPLTPVRIISHPDAHFYTLTTGHVSRYCRIDGQEYITVTADVAVGSSGGPVLDRRGNVVGMVCMTQTAYTIPEDVPLELVPKPERKPTADAEKKAETAGGNNGPAVKPPAPAPAEAKAGEAGAPSRPREKTQESGDDKKSEKPEKPGKPKQDKSGADAQHNPYPEVDPQMVFKHCVPSGQMLRCFTDPQR